MNKTLLLIYCIYRNYAIKMSNTQASRVAQRSKALHHCASCVTTDPGSIKAVSQIKGCVAVPRPGEPWGDTQLAQRYPG